MLTGTVRVGEREWNVREERRAGPRSQMFRLTDPDGGQAEMHIRSLARQEAQSLEEVALLAVDPQIRYFLDAGGQRWEARIVVRVEPGAQDTRLVKFISDALDVREVGYPFSDGLGHRSEDELCLLLAHVK